MIEMAMTPKSTPYVATASEAERMTVSGRSILLVAPKAPPYGGMAVQADLLEQKLRTDGNSVVFFPSNLPLPRWLWWIDAIPGIRPFVRSAVICCRLPAQIRRADVVHVLAASWIYFFLVVCPAIILSRAHGKRVVLNYRAGNAGEFFSCLGWAIKPIFKLADSVTAPSEFLAEIIRQRFSVKVDIVPNISDRSAFQYRKRTVFQPKLLSTRHLEEIYDIESVLRAFRLIQEKHAAASLWIAGTGSQEEYLRSLVARWKLQHVRFLGNIAHRDLPAIYDQCDVLLNASRVDNFPGALLEASAAGLVVVTTAAGGIPFMYKDGETALLAEPGNWQELATAVQKVLASPSLGAKLVSEAVILAQRCEWKNIRTGLYRSYGFV